MGKTFVKPANRELEILKVLWSYGGCTARQVHRYISAKRDTGRTTVLKRLQIMYNKGLVMRDDSGFPQRYRAASDQQATTTGIVQDLIHKLFGGSTQGLVMHLLSTQYMTPAELKTIQRRAEEKA
jgi:BlaI family transcriptional regulator, penicillinase repressor